MEEGHVKFYALRDIAIDEELTFSYIDEDIPPKERKELIFPVGIFTAPASVAAKRNGTVPIGLLPKWWNIR